MATYKDLSNKEQIQSIKDSLILLLESLASNPERLVEYIKVEKSTGETISPDEKTKLEERIDLQKATFDKVMGFLRNCKKQKGCVCQQGCYDITITNSVLPTEFEPLLAAARKQAETRTY